MSNKLVTLAWKATSLNPLQTLVLVRLCDRADDAGRGIYFSTATIMADTRIGRGTLFRVLAKLEQIGLVLNDPDGPSHRTVSRIIHVPTLRALASETRGKSDDDNSYESQSGTDDQSQSGTPEWDTRHPLSILKTSSIPRPREDRPDFFGSRGE